MKLDKLVFFSTDAWSEVYMSLFV